MSPKIRPNNAISPRKEIERRSGIRESLRLQEKGLDLEYDNPMQIVQVRRRSAVSRIGPSAGFERVFH
jgi:hypothetical protein